MKKMTMIMIGISVVVIGAMAVSWAQMTQQTAPVTPQPAPTVAAPVAAQPPAKPTIQPVIQVPQAAALPQPVPTPAPAVAQQPAAQNNTPEALRQSAENDFAGKLSFPANEQKMIAFAKAAIRIEKINEKWDVQIASAEDDKTAIEYSNFAVEESTKLFQTMDGITLDQFNEMTQLTAKDSNFNRVFLAYKQLVQEGAFNAKTGNLAKPLASPVVNPSAPAVTAPSVPAVQTTPSASQAGSGTVPAPAGLPAPPYSQPATR